MKHIFQIIFVLMLAWAKASAAEPLPFVHPMFASHMVLQRDATDPMWGWAKPGDTVTVTVLPEGGSLPIQTKTAVAGDDGRWQVLLGPFALRPGNQALNLTISAADHPSVTLSDVLIGDVWLCSGQSNMARSLAYHEGIPDIPNQDAEIADTIHYPLIRQYYVANLATATPQALPTLLKTDETGSSGPWLINNPTNAKAPSRYSAVAYFFARELFQTVKVPVGIVQMSWGGTSIQGWIDPVTLSEDPNFKNAASVPANANQGGIYNGKIATITPFRFKGVIWYQGENNASAPEQYRTLLPLLFKSWRKGFQQADLPFIVIQLPNFQDEHWPILRDAQLNAVLNDPRSRLVVTIDLADPKQLHPNDKQDVARRALLAAEDVAYGKRIVSSGPLLATASRAGSAMVCRFTSVGKGLMAGLREIPPTKPGVPTTEVKGGLVNGFELAGEDGVFHPATAKITGKDTLEVSSPAVSAPVSVRYAWAGAPNGNLYNKFIDRKGTLDGLPASPFRFPK
jgi:sialate O-acetylesterase